MISLLIFFCILSFLVGICLKLLGVIVTLSFWLIIKIPFAIILWVIGFAFCCTILLIPLGILCFKAGMQLLAA